MNGLGFLNIELTSRCNANCWCCGRRKLEREYPDKTNWGDMDFELVQKISQQVPSGIVVQFHANGEPTLYPRLGKALELFKHCIRQFDTNGKLIFERFDEIIDNLEVLTISVIEREETDEQYDIVKQFLNRKGNRKPLLVYRLLGDIRNSYRWGQLEGIIAKRVLHRPEGSFGYAKPVTIPEIGICLDLLTHLAIDRFGDVSICVRFDPEKHGVIGSIKSKTLSEIWNGPLRKHYIQSHLDGYRDKLFLCKNCDYYGVPTA